MANIYNYAVIIVFGPEAKDSFYNADSGTNRLRNRDKCLAWYWCYNSILQSETTFNYKTNCLDCSKQILGSLGTY